MIEPMIFLGPPGTGKTTTLLDTVLMEMDRGVPPDRIGFMTFTKRGVEEAISRASVRFNLARDKFRHFNTLHSAAFRHLGLSHKQVFTGKKVQEFGKAEGLELYGGMSSDDGTYTGFYGDDLILFLENYSRITRTPLEQVLQKNNYMIPDFQRAWKCIHGMRKFKVEQGLYDFTDMLEEFIRLDDPPRLDVLIVDEAQDLSELQWIMVNLLSRYVKRIYIAGDDDQTIFTWAGASEQFISMSGKVKILEQSYRVPITVHELADRMITTIFNRRQKVWRPRDAEGSVTRLSGLAELDPVRLDKELGSVMMLARTTKFLRQKFIPYCRHHGLLYKHFDHPSILLPVRTAIQAWSELYEGKAIPADEIVRIYNLLPSEGHKEKPGIKRGGKSKLGRLADQPEPPRLTMQDLKQDYGLMAEGTWDEVFTEIEPKDVEYIKKVMDNGFSLLNKPHIHISTIHRVKGGQADTVILMSDTPKVQDKMMTTNQDEETRVFYTAVTRTFEDLIVIDPEKRYFYGGLYS